MRIENFKNARENVPHGENENKMKPPPVTRWFHFIFRLTRRHGAML